MTANFVKFSFFLPNWEKFTKNWLKKGLNVSSFFSISSHINSEIVLKFNWDDIILSRYLNFHVSQQSTQVISIIFSLSKNPDLYYSHIIIEWHFLRYLKFYFRGHNIKKYQAYERWILEAPPVDPRTYIYRYYNIGPKEGL